MPLAPTALCPGGQAAGAPPGDCDVSYDRLRILAVRLHLRRLQAAGDGEAPSGRRDISAPGASRWAVRRGAPLGQRTGSAARLRGPARPTRAPARPVGNPFGGRNAITSPQSASRGSTCSGPPATLPAGGATCIRSSPRPDARGPRRRASGPRHGQPRYPSRGRPAVRVS